MNLGGSMDHSLAAAVAAISYLLGSIPTAYLAGRAAGVDIRSKGSGNAGATNALRVLGPGAAALTLAVDAGKGVAAVLLAAPAARLAWTGALGRAAATDTGTLAVLAGAACVLGHVFPVWLRFKGGKGVATGAAVAAALAPAAALPCLAVFGAVLALGRYVSLASLAAAAVLPPAYALLYRGERFSPAVLGFFAGAAALVLLAHRKNLGRLLAGAEPRLGERRKGERRKGERREP